MDKNDSWLSRYTGILSAAIRLSPSLFLLNFVLIILNSALNIINLLAPKYFLLSLKSQDIKQFSLTVFAFSIGNMLMSSVSAYLDPYLSKKTELFNADLINGFLQKSISLNLASFDESGFYDNYALAFDKCCEVFQTVINSFFQVVYSIGQLVVVGYVLSWMNPLYLCILLIFAIVQTIIGNKIKIISYQNRVQITSNKKRLNYIYRLFYIPEFMRDIRINTLSDFVFRKKKKATQQIINDTYNSQTKIAKKRILQSMISFAEMLVVMMYFGAKVISGDIWYDTFAISQSSYNQLKVSIMNLLSIYNTVYENDLYAQRYLSFMKSDDLENTGALHLSAKEIQTVEFLDVSFSYPNANTAAVQNVSFKINRGEKILITGRTGAGKTTIIKLLLRLYKPQSGRILINGNDISEYDVNELRNSFAVLFQDYAIYAFTVRENLCLRNDIENSLINTILEKADLSPLFMKLNNGLDTPISCQLDNEGVELSGGEKQKLAIARTLLKNSDIYILDEPTSNLDSNSAQLLMSNLLCDKDNTVIMITHQLSFAQNTTRIICFDKGTIAEMGKHEELLKKQNGLYSQFYSQYLRGLT